MKVLAVILLVATIAMSVMAAPSPKAAPNPGELAMIEARDVFEGTAAEAPADGRSAGEPDSVPPEPKLSENEADPNKLFKRQSCPTNYWYCRRVNGCCKRSPEYRCCDFGCCRPGYYCCGLDGRCWRSWMC